MRARPLPGEVGLDEYRRGWHGVGLVLPPPATKKQALKNHTHPSIGKRVGSVHFCPVNMSVTMRVLLRATKVLNKEQRGLPRGENRTLVSNCKMCTDCTEHGSG